MQDAQVAAKLQGQMAAFSGKVSAGLPKVARRLVREVIFGIQSRGSVRLSEIGRALDEPTALKKVIERLGRGLERSGLRQRVRENQLALGAARVADRTLLVTDLTDLSKPHAKEMEHLAWVRDGSTGEIVPGYECCQVVAVRRGSAEVVPLYQELYSTEAPGFVSENREVLKAVERVSKATEGRGVWVIDRGGDRRKILEPLLEEGRAFLVRMRGDRHLVWRRGGRSVEWIAERIGRPYRQTVVKEEGAKERVYELRFGATTVRVPGYEQKLSLVVVEGLGRRPLMLLTTLRTGRSKKRCWRVVESYLSRWRVEETIRFIKQSYELEDIRLLRYERLRSMATLVMAVAYFACAYLGRRAKLRILIQHVYRASQRIYGIPEFRFYAVADGIKQVLFGRRRRPGSEPGPGSSPELLLFPLGP